ncbi:MAG TPA: hypothetical protein VGR81_00400 [Candidatus Acidoferrales bacterium]|nr:hypothetical protein [Candidatus Acidoferrales bacterium]
MLRAWWNQFCEINKSIFRLKGDDFAYFTIVGLVVIVADVVAAFSTIYVSFLKFVVGLLVSDDNLRARILAEPLSGHAEFRILFMLSLMAAVYLFLYAFRAPEVLMRRQRDAAAARDGMAAQIKRLEHDKQALVLKSNYRDQLAAAVGMRVTSVKRFCYILNEKGDSRVRQEETFVVLGLEVKHLVRKLRSYTATGRKQPKIEALGLPADRQPETTCQQSGPETRFHIRFKDAIPKGQAVTLLITEEIDGNFKMAYGKDSEEEYVGHWVYEPTELLELYVEFPKNYDISREDVWNRTTYGMSETRHHEEEERMHKEGAVSRTFNADGKLALGLTVKNPILTLAYQLCWKPKKA